jgi:4-phytase / acid phosphatase
MAFGTDDLQDPISDLRRLRTATGATVRAGLIGALAVAGLAFLPTTASAQSQEVAGGPPGTLLKFVILSRHGVRSPTLDPKELATWTKSPWPEWTCATKTCAPGQLTPRGYELATQMGAYYRRYLAALLPETPQTPCPDPHDLFVWADVTDTRTRDTAQALLQGFRPRCDPGQYIRTRAPNDPIFHPVGSCRLDADRAEQEIRAKLPNVLDSLRSELSRAQNVLQCCDRPLCEKVWGETCQAGPPPNSCQLDNLPTCVVRSPKSGAATKVQLGGGLRIASTFAEILLLEYANGFKGAEFGWDRVKTPEELTALFRLHTEAFDLEQRTPTIARTQGSALLQRILFALQVNAPKDKVSDAPGTAPQGTKFAAYVGHDTNISNIGGMLGLSWDPPAGQHPGYQKNQTPPAGALTFELRDVGGVATLYVAYVAQSLADMHAGTADQPVRTPVSVPNCSGRAPWFPCPLATFEPLVNAPGMLDPNCAQ